MSVVPERMLSVCPVTMQMSIVFSRPTHSSVHVRHVRRRAVEVAELVPVAVEERVDVVLARERHDLVDRIRMPEPEVRRVVRAEGRAERRDASGRLRARPHERHDLVVEVLVVLIVPPDPLGRVLLLRVEALGVHAVHARELDRAALDQVLHRRRQPEVLVLVEAPDRSRKPDHRPAGVAEPEHLHAAAEDRGIPGEIFTVHARKPTKGILRTPQLGRGQAVPPSTLRAAADGARRVVVGAARARAAGAGYPPTAISQIRQADCRFRWCERSVRHDAKRHA